MDVTLICFSQTGNTRQVATAMAGAFREGGHAARTISLKKATPEDATGGDLLGVGTACLSSQAPTPIKEFLRALPPLDDQPAFVFATSSGAPGRVLYDLASLLRRKGADVLGGFLARGQVHHPAPHLTGQFPGRPNAEDLSRARRFAVAVAEHVSANRSGPLPEGRPDALKLRWGLYDLIGLIGTDALLRRMMPEPKPDPAKCDLCQRRYRCLTGCPQQALAANWRLADPFLLLLYNAAFMRWLGGLQPGE